MFGGSNYIGCKVFRKFYRLDLEIWGGGVGKLGCGAVVAGAAEVGVGGEKKKSKKSKISKSCKKVGNGWKRVFECVLRCVEVFLVYFRVGGGVFEGWG